MTITTVSALRVLMWPVLSDMYLAGIGTSVPFGDPGLPFDAGGLPIAAW